MQLWTGRVFLTLCVTAMGCATESPRENPDIGISHVLQARGVGAVGEEEFH
jgi:hypothetical protein